VDFRTHRRFAVWPDYGYVRPVIRAKHDAGGIIPVVSLSDVDIYTRELKARASRYQGFGP
jgi:hypothetical protein